MNFLHQIIDTPGTGSTLSVDVDIPARIEQAVSDAVVYHLETEFGGRGLLLTTEALVAAEAHLAQRGTRLLTRVIQRCYPMAQACTLKFESEHEASRIGAALAFGAVTAVALVEANGDAEQLESSVELICAMFNLGIGLVDSLCDSDPKTGAALLELVHERGLVGIAERPRTRGWLRATVPLAFAQDSTVAFAVEIIETFFETLHAAYPGDEWLRLRRGVGTQLGAALEAEQHSIARSAYQTPRTELIEYSRRTSVLPFQIIETLVGIHHTADEPTPGTQLGEAMWRIDDLVDLCDDARSGALNSLLLRAATGVARPGERDLVDALEHLLESTDIERAAVEAAELLQVGLGRGNDHVHTASFLSFIQRYAGIAPRQPL